MKYLFAISVALVLGCGGTQAALYSKSFSGVNAVIPDGNPVGIAVVGDVTDLSPDTVVAGLTVNLDISGGYNGDLYAYLVAPNGTLVTLLNQPGVAVNGFGASGGGLNVTLDDAASTSIQTQTDSSVLHGAYTAAGSLADFNGSSANGSWALFFADGVNGGGQSTLNGWSLEITAVPEPVNVALASFGGLLVLIGLMRRISSAE